MTSTKIQKRFARARRTGIIAKKSGRPRLVVFRSNRAIYGQVIDDAAGKTLCGVSTLKSTNTVEGAKAAGKQLAEMAKKHNVAAVAFDRNGYLYHGKVKALADGAREGGLQF